MIGTTLSHYRIVERLGRGGMGDVFLAEDLRLHRPVALKLLHQQPGCEEEERARLLSEARAASALNHPNIAVIYDVGESDTPSGRVYLLAMEYVPGVTLEDLAAEGSLSLDEILDLMSQAADALAEAHTRGIIHRDVKPSNMMVTQGRLKILDFGLARPQSRPAGDAQASGRDETVPLEDPIAGTPHYMSPEQALGQPLDARSDLFSLGIVLYELLAGRRPFEGDNFIQVTDAVLHRDPPPLPIRFTDPRLPEVEHLVARMLAKSMAARPKDLSEVRDDLTRLRAGTTMPAPAEGTLTVAVAGFANITLQPEDEWLGIGLTETVTTALQEIEGLEVWGRERLRANLRRLEIDGAELGSEDAMQLGRATGARWVVAGGFQRMGEHVRVTTRVVEVESGNVLRATRNDGRLEALFALQDRIVVDLVAGLRKTVAAAHEGEETQILAAYEALSKGLLNMRADSYESLDRGILFFERALTLDPDYVRAQIELGAAWAQKADYLAAPELHERAVSILRRALKSRPRLPRVWRELGMTLVAQGHLDEGLECLERATSLAPEDARVLGGMGRALFIGKADFAGAAEYYGRALERNPEAGWYWMQLAHCLALLRDFARGESAAKRAIELQEAFLSGQQGVQLVGAYMRMGHLLALQGRFREASEAHASEFAFTDRLDHALRSRIRIELHMRLGAALLAMGDGDGAKESFAAGIDAFSRRLALGADEPFTRYYAAAIHALRGDVDEALALLEGAAAGSPAFVLARARIEPEWDHLRGDPRFDRLIHPSGSQPAAPKLDSPSRP
jgi:TolB-like protein